MKTEFDMTGKYWCLFFFILGAVVRSQAQAPVYITAFSNSFGGSLKEDFFAGATCSDGGYLMTGFTNSVDGDIDPLLAYDTTNIFVVKCNASGTKEWAKTFGGNGYDKARYVMEDNDGNILVVGGTHSSDGDIDSTHGLSEFFILKLNEFGNKIWMKQYGGTGYESGRFIQQLPSGDYLVAGYSTSHDFDVPVNRGLHDGWLMKLDVDGTLIWSKTYGGSGEDRMRSFVQTPDGGFLFFGSSSSNNFQVSGNNGGADFWVGKVDSLGNHQWSRLYGGSADDLAYHITPTADGNYLLTGCTFSNDGDITGYHGGTDGWLVKIDSLGNLLWQRTYGGTINDRLNRSYEKADGKIITFGFSQSNDFDLVGSNTGPSNNFWLAQLDSTGNIEWNYCTGGTNTDLGEDIFFNGTDSSFVLMGDSKSVNGAVLNNHGDFDFWIVKIALFTSLAEFQNTEELHAYYDYNSQKLVVNSGIKTAIGLIITDAAGKIVSEQNGIKISKGENQIAIDESADITTGVYNIQLRSGKFLSTVRFVKIH